MIRVSSTARTLAIALMATVVVFSALAYATSDSRPTLYILDQWQAGGRNLIDPGPGLRLGIGQRPTIVVHRMPPRDATYSLLTFDFYLDTPLEPQAGLLYRGGAEEGAPYRVFDFSEKVNRTGWTHVAISADEARGLEDAREIAFSIVSQAGENVAGLRNVTLQGFSLPERLRQMLSALLTPEPLGQASINFVGSPRVAGRGYIYILWAAFLISVLLLLPRRLLLGERAQPLRQAVIALLALFVLADLRNSVDYLSIARDALARHARAPSLDARLRISEPHYPWFADAVVYLRENLPRGRRYLFNVGGAFGTPNAARRAAYYALPARRTFSADEADTVLAFGVPLVGYERSPAWRRVAVLPSGLRVYERSR